MYRISLIYYLTEIKPLWSLHSETQPAKTTPWHEVKSWRFNQQYAQKIVLLLVVTLWLFNIAMENGPFIDDKQYIDMIPFT